MTKLGCWMVAAVVCPALWAPAARVASTPLAQRVADQNALFEQFYQTGLKNNPVRATIGGAMPLDLLDARVNRWITQQTAKTGAVAQR